MKKVIYIIASLIICASIASAFPVVYADELDTTIPPVEYIQQETVPSEEDVEPASLDYQPDEIND